MTNKSVYKNLLKDKSFRKILNVFLRSYFLLIVCIFNNFNKKIPKNNNKLTGLILKLIFSTIKIARN